MGGIASSGALVTALRAAMAARSQSVIERIERAAVLVPIVIDTDPAKIILTRRTEALSTHQGQVAFPGGRVDAADGDVVGAALREATEEIGLPADRVAIVGLLDDQITREGTVAVTPCVGVVTKLPPLAARPEEVARIFTVPLSELAMEGRWRRESWLMKGRSVPVDFFDHDGECLWGLSSRIVLNLLELIRPIYGLPGGRPEPDGA